MAAVRRSSGSGVIVALVVFVVLTFVGIGCAIWFLQQFKMARQAIATNQSAFEEVVGSVFVDKGWQLTKTTPTEQGFTFNQESYSDVAAKLAEAAEYEQEVLPLLGWQSLDGIKSAMAESPAQTAAEERGEPTYHELRLLLSYYEESYTRLNREVADLRSRNDDLSKRLEETKESLVQTEQRLQGRLSEATQKFESDLNQLRSDYNDLVTRHNRQREEATDWRGKYQEEVNARKTQVTSLQDRIATLQKRVEDLLAGPEGLDRLRAQGQVIEVRSDYDFVLIEGGRDRGIEENDRFIVYSVMPDGRGRKKGELLVGQVYEHTALATIAREDEYIVVGDPFVSLQRWDWFERRRNP